MKKIILPIITMVTLAAATGAAFADESADNSWQFAATVPLWAPQINGTATVKGRERDVDISFSQLKDHLDASFALGVAASKGKFGLFGDVGYMKFSVGSSLPGGGNTASGLKFVLADAGASYQLVKVGEERPFVLAGTLGLRYWYADTFLKLKDAGGVVLFDGTTSKSLEDPVIGLRGSQYFTPKLHLDFAGDIGGFGMSVNQATLDWSATGALTYDFAKWFSLSAGYKAVGLDYSNGSGVHKNGANLVFSGALIAATFKF